MVKQLQDRLSGCTAVAVLAASLGAGQAAAAERVPAYEFGLAYTGDYMQVVQGGTAQGGRWLDNLDLTLRINTEQAWGLRNGTLYLYAIRTGGGQPNADLLNSTQGIDNIEASNDTKLYEAWYEHAFAHSTLRFGLYDLNSEFDSIETAGLFINPSHGIGVDYSQSGQNGPSIFPNTSLTLRYAAKQDNNVYWQLAVLDGIPGDPNNPTGTHIILDPDDGVLLAAETGVHRGEGATLWHWGVGGWHYSKLSTADAAGNSISPSNNQGLYAFAESALTDSLAAHLRAGLADATINRVASYVGGGLVWSGLFGQVEDRLGLALAIANNSASYIAATGDKASETNVELTYRRQLNKWLSVQPDIQYVINPGSKPAVPDALIAGVRFEAAF